MSDNHIVQIFQEGEHYTACCDCGWRGDKEVYIKQANASADEHYRRMVEKTIPVTHLEAFIDTLEEDHEKYSKSIVNDDEVFFALGMGGEVGELQNFIKKELRDNVDFTIDKRLEAADVLVYLMMWNRSQGYTFQRLVETAAYKHEVFIRKMERRDVETKKN